MGILIAISRAKQITIRIMYVMVDST